MFLQANVVQLRELSAAIQTYCFSGVFLGFFLFVSLCRIYYRLYFLYFEVEFN